ncbi:MAG: efflux RND transporter periplasmic adaptor subunit [Patescibacteria group bacterium]|nr:efflux RND transporter periplasmic adaptor subunit [Patescibacteria group bacterium]
MTKKKKILLIVIGIILLIVVSSLFFKKPNIAYSTDIVKKQNLKQTVSETGTIKSADEIELNFQNVGKITKILVKVNDKVKENQILAELDHKNLDINAKNAIASLDIAKANLNKLISGATQYEINVKQTSVNKAEIEYESALNELEEVKLSGIKTSAQAETDALILIDTNISKAQTAVDNINTILNDSEAQYLLGVKNTSILYQTKNSYNDAKLLISNAKTHINTAKNTKTRNDIKLAINKTIEALDSTFSTLTNSYQMLEDSITSYQFTQTELDAYKTIVSTQQTSISTALSSVKGALNTLNNTELNNDGINISGSQAIVTAQSRVDSYYQAFQLAQAQLDELKAPARSQDITLYQAQVRQAEANLESIQNQIEYNIIRAPIDGIITRIEYKKGEQVASTKAAIKMLSENKLEIEVDISESDIIKIKLNDPAEITLDALSEEEKLYGRVYDIDPAETIIQDVIYYKVKIDFDIPEELLENIKPGMTANIIITTKNKSDVLIIPSRSIIEKNGDGKFVRILENKKVKEIPVKTGIYGDDGMVEILSGLTDGQEIITSINTKK